MHEPDERTALSVIFRVGILFLGLIIACFGALLGAVSGTISLLLVDALMPGIIDSSDAGRALFLAFSAVVGAASGLILAVRFALQVSKSEETE